VSDSAAIGLIVLGVMIALVVAYLEIKHRRNR